MDEKRVRIAAQLYEARETVRRLHGKQYQTVIKQFIGFVQAEMAQKKCDEITAAMNIVCDLQRDCPDSGMSQAMILAACVELIEPTPEPASDQ